ncbi:lipopolysaccharide biosynthesis protein [Fibrivirga algicola]|uniref:Oligosaccharide flippase family protein n=1 Tax=Fibrivirga algicola TaxID=2950420 RepID=A0ABX0QIJ0_9BACT|nr:MATE family efflux transporter [Fibrivirga algicola]NID12281.1 oligosaccharide flippase family protein [Fibrivirga algicola]
MVANLRSRVTGFFVNGHERTLLVKKNIALTFLTKAGGILISLVLVPMTIDYVSPAQYGVWLTISSIIGWLNFFDVGLGNGLKNKLTQSTALGETEQARMYISTTYAALIGIAALTFFLFMAANRYVNWGKLLNVSGANAEGLESVMLMALGCFCVQFVAQLINTILTATHQSASASYITFFGQLCSVIAIYVCKQYLPGSLFTLVCIIASTPVIALAVGSFLFFRHKLQHLAPSWKLVNMTYARGLLNAGGKFFLIQIGALVLFQTNYILISQLLGPEQVTVYSVCYKLFSVVIMIFTIIVTPMWSSFADAYAKGDFEWLTGSLQKMRKVWLLFSLATLAILSASPMLFTEWIGKSVSVPWTLSICMTVYVIAYIWQMMHVYFLNGIGKIQLQLILVTVSAILNIPVCILLGKSFGLVGIVATSTILFTVMGIIFSIQCQKICTSKANKVWGK